MACIKCGSENIGYDSGSGRKLTGAAIGGALNQASGGSPLVGAAIGAMLAGKGKCVCLKCGETWEPKTQSKLLEAAEEIAGYTFDLEDSDHRESLVIFVQKYKDEREKEAAKKIKKLRSKIEENVQKPHNKNKLTLILHLILAVPFAYAAYSIFTAETSDGVKVAGVISGFIALYFINHGLDASRSSEDKVKSDRKELGKVLKKYDYLKPMIP